MLSILTIISLFFIWLIVRQVYDFLYKPGRFHSSDYTYLFIIVAFAIATAWLPIKYWQLEKSLSEKSSILAGKPAKVHCNSLFDSIFDNQLNVIGHANFETGDIVFQFGWCRNMLKYLDHPNDLTELELMSLALFTHEAMHVRGERNEQKTECQAIQRNYQAAKLLGVQEHIAQKNAVDYYKNIYPRHPYFSPRCAPGKEYDEKLDDSSWNFL